MDSQQSPNRKCPRSYLSQRDKESAAPSDALVVILSWWWYVN